jgi:actin, other eukaryote
MKNENNTTEVLVMNFFYWSIQQPIISNMSEEEEEVKTLVIDFGSSSIKSGFGGDDAPRSVIPCIRGTPKEKPVYESNTKDYIGDIAEVHKGYLTIEHPISDGIIQNWDTFEKLLHQIIFNELRTAPNEGNCLMTEPSLGPMSQKEKKTQILFETFDVKGFYLAAPPRLAHMSSGRNTAFIIDIGDTVTETMAITDGYSIESAIQRFNFGGRDITKYLIKLMTGRGYYFQSSSDFLAVQKIKEQLGCVSMDFNTDIIDGLMSDKFEKTYELPDQNVLTIGTERFKSFEILFNPSLVSKELPGVHEMIHNGILSTDIDLRSMFYGNILVSGGTSMIGYFTDRLDLEIKKLAPSNSKVKIVAPPERKYSTWIGGSILSSLTTFQKCFISKDEYDENGPSLIHNKTL